MSTVSTLLASTDSSSWRVTSTRRRPKLALARPTGVRRDGPAPAVVVSSSPGRSSRRGRTFSRYVGGTYPSTVEVVRFSDGTRARTDLVRLNPDIAAYSIDYAGVAPRDPSRYRDEVWGDGTTAGRAAAEGEVVWILRHSFPTLGTAQLSADLRAAGVPIGVADIREHEAIAGTQAAIWSLTNGLSLDTQPLSVPIAVSADQPVRGASPGAVLDQDARSTWRASLVPGQERYLEFEFDGRPQLGDYTVELGPRTTTTAVGWWLQRSNDRHTWRDVSSSEVEVAYGGAGRQGAVAHTKALGFGATLCDSVPFTVRTGYRYFRLVLQSRADTTAQIEVRAVRFTIADQPRFRNAAAVVHLYQYLLDRATTAVLGVPTLSINGPPVVETAAGNGLAGPFHIGGDRPADVRVTGACGGRVVDRDGALLRGPAHPGRPFYVDLRAGDVPGSFTLTAAVGPVPGYAGRALVGARSDDGPAEFTPLARVVRVVRHAVAAFQVRCLACEFGNRPA